MKKMFAYRRRLFFYIILLVLVGIWGRVIYTVHLYVDSDSENNNAVAFSVDKTALLDLAEGSERIPYKENFPDPFEPSSALFNQESQGHAFQIAEIELPDVEQPVFVLLGITGYTATLRDSNDELHFVKPGDWIEEVSIVEVHNNRVVADFQTKTFTIKMVP